MFLSFLFDIDSLLSMGSILYFIHFGSIFGLIVITNSLINLTKKAKQ